MRVSKIQRPLEYKNAPSALRATDDQLGEVEGYLSFFHNIDAQGDKILPGAYMTTIKDSYARKASQNLDFLVPLLYNHIWETTVPIGGIFSMWEDAKGLFVKARFNLGTQLGAEIYESCKGGFLSKFSIGYKTIKSDWQTIEGKQVRLLKEIQLLEGSIVQFPANDMAQVTAVKNQGGGSMLLAKDFNSNYQSQQLDDWQYDDWGDISNALHASIQELFSNGSDPLAALESDVFPGLESAIRAYVQQGIDLGFTGSSSSNYGMMGLAYSGESKAGYLSVASHAKIAAASSAIMKHAKIVQSELASLESARARRRAGQLAGWPVYGSASNTSILEEKELDEDDRMLLKTVTTSLAFSNAVRESHDELGRDAEAAQISAGVDAALERYLAAEERKGR